MDQFNHFTSFPYCFSCLSFSLNSFCQTLTFSPSMLKNFLPSLDFGPGRHFLNTPSLLLFPKLCSALCHSLASGRPPAEIPSEPVRVAPAASLSCPPMGRSYSSGVFASLFLLCVSPIRSSLCTLVLPQHKDFPQNKGPWPSQCNQHTRLCHLWARCWGLS